MTKRLLKDIEQIIIPASKKLKGDSENIWKAFNNIPFESKKRRELDNIKLYVSGTDVKNYLLKDPRWRVARGAQPKSS